MSFCRLSLALILVASSAAPAAAASAINTKPQQILYGASVYPELQTRPEWNRMLDDFQKAHINMVRVTESSWGNLETGPGKYNFTWLREFLDDLHKRGMKAVLGTSSYIAPQWFFELHPEARFERTPGEPVHSHGRHAPCLSHPAYRQAVESYTTALAKAFKDHPTVIGWQLDNEIEHKILRICHNQACQRAWSAWLKDTYRTPAEFNRRLHLVSWGMQVTDLDKVELPTYSNDGDLTAIRLAQLHFRRDEILDFFTMQTLALRKAGVNQWIMTDWNTYFTALADDPKAKQSLDIAGLNFYQPSVDNPKYFRELAYHFDMHRAAHRTGYFMATETRFGVAGSTAMSSPFPSFEQFRMWMMQPIAFGSNSLIYWSGNRWIGGHWPHWGGLLDWSGKPEPDFDWAIRIGEILKKWSAKLLEHPVDAQTVMLTDFDNRAALYFYPHTPSSKEVITETADALHRLGMGIDTINSLDARQPGALDRYKLLIIPAATSLNGDALAPVLRAFAERGGHVIVSPFTAYQTWDGVFHSKGFGADIAGITGVTVRTARRMGTAADEGFSDQLVTWKTPLVAGTSPAGIDGYCEYLDVEPDTEVIATFRSSEPILEGRPAATLRKIGKGSVLKLAFWPADDSLARLLQKLLPTSKPWITSPAPLAVQAVPRTDGSLFVLNTLRKPASFALGRAATDRLTGRSVPAGEVSLKGYDVLWLE
jgi:beta-galactosidase